LLEFISLRTPWEELPEEIGMLAELTHLDLRATHLARLPEGMDGLRRLEKLDLRWTNLHSLPPWLAALRERGCRVLL
jgi:Leucine-rich repeat (LRR) protein